MEETMYGQGANMGDVWMRQPPSHASLRSHASTATQQINMTAIPLRDLENATPAPAVDPRSHMVYLHGWTFYTLTFASVLPY